MLRMRQSPPADISVPVTVASGSAGNGDGVWGESASFITACGGIIACSRPEGSAVLSVPESANKCCLTADSNTLASRCP